MRRSLPERWGEWMGAFTYRALDPGGRTRRGEVEAADATEALDHLARRGLIPITLTAGSRPGPWWGRELTFGSQGRTFRAHELEQFFSTLASMLQAHVPVSRALRAVSSLTSAGPFKRHLDQAQAALENGSSLASALMDAQGRFPERLTRVIALGEASNSLAAAVEAVAKSLRAGSVVRAQLRQALIYPAILLAMSFIVLNVLIFFLAPSLLPIFESTDTPAPVVIALMAGLRSTVLEAWPILATLLGMIVVFSLLLRRSIGRVWQGLLLRLPVTGQYLRQSDTLRFCRSVELMLGSGARLLTAVEEASRAVHLQPWRVLAEQVAGEIRSGGRLAETLLASRLVDPKAAVLLSAAEDSDSLRATLPVIAADLEQRTARTLAQAVQLLGPAITLIIGLLIGFIILSTITAIMDLNDAVL